MRDSVAGVSGGAQGAGQPLGTEVGRLVARRRRDWGAVGVVELADGLRRP